ncbi:MAG: shikimate dehydrogenase [Candidatus Dadabacteria bacterium]|nr:shikimate dehydrogenase [Candidatus Dadabacteria bacterium]NIQ15314.1 shikimate dehydrogenase [Candidatus Dadabacteria bacterium]
MNIKATTKIYGIFGHPVSHSLSPVMHNSAFEELGLDCVYVALDIDPANVSHAVESIRFLNLYGINVTIPHKQAVIPYLDEISDEARLIGAVNTIKNEKGVLRGFNTDVGGVLRAMKENVNYSPEGTTALLVGAGGAARAVICGLCLNNAKKIYLVNRTLEKAENLSSEFLNNFSSIEIIPIELNDSASVAQALKYSDILINSSSAGMENNNPLDLPIEKLNKDSVVYDLVYKPMITPLVEAAREHGYKAESGLSMLLYQGVEAFEIWTGKDAPVEIMREALLMYQ